MQPKQLAGFGVGYMKEHAMVCSDYAIKTISCDLKNLNEVILERQFRLEELKKLQVFIKHKK